MEKDIKRTYIFFSFMFFVLYGMHAQDTNKQEPLRYVINSLQKQYGIQFNYAEDTVEAVFLVPPSGNLSFPQVIAYLEATTGLSFIKMSESIVLIKPKDNIVFCGYLKDKVNLQPLVEATIQTINNSAITDENGFFQIEIKHINELITIRFLGYKTVIKPYNELKKSDCQDVLLSPNFESLSEVVISNYITSGINKISNGSYEINFSDFNILPGLIDNDVLQSVQAFPGIQSINETVSNINIRGGNNDQNLILWDGIKMYQSGHFFGLISMYNPQITQKVSLRKNGSDVSFTDGVSGTIAMQTENTVNNAFEGTVGANLTDLNAFADIPIGASSSIQIAARKSINDFIETPTYTAYFNRISQNTEVTSNTATITNTDETFDFYDTSFRWIYKINDKEELRLNFINVHNQLQFNENATINNQEQSRESKLTQNSIAGALHYNRLWSNRFNSELEVYETDYKLKAVNANLLDAQRFLQENKVSETSIKLKTNYTLNNYLELLSGYHIVETKVTNLDDVDIPLSRVLVSEVLRTHGLFSQIGYRSFNEKTRLNIGVRYNYIDKFKKSIWEPRLSFNHRFLNYFSFEILGEFKHQNTSQVINFQNDFLGIEKRRWQLSNNKDIPVIQSKQISSGISYSQNSWLLNFDLYYKKVNGITSQSQGFQNQFEFEKSVGSYDVKGLDALIRKRLNKIDAWLCYTYMYNNYFFDELSESSFPSNFDVSHTITFGTVYKLNNLKVSSGFNWHSGKPFTKPQMGNEVTGNNINYESPNSDNLKDYLRIDFSAIYDFKIAGNTNASLGVSVWNVLDRKNEISNFFRVNEEGGVTKNEQSSLGITPNATFRITF